MIRKPEDPERHELVGKLLDSDSVASAEELTGKTIDNDELTQRLGLGLQLSKGRMLKKLFIDSGDFTISDEWSRRRSILERNNFQQMYEAEYSVEGRNYAFHIWLEPTYGIVFTQEIYEVSYDDHDASKKQWRNADHGQAHFCWRPNEGEDKHQFLHGVSGGWESEKYPEWRRMPPPPGSNSMFFTPDDLYMRGHFQGNGGLIHRLQTLLMHGTFLNPWPEWKDGRHPLAMFIYRKDDESKMDAVRLAGFNRLEHLSTANTLRYDSFPEQLRKVMNIKPTWRRLP